MKEKTPRDKKYLEWIRTQPCVITGYSPDYGARIEAAHVRWGSGAGTGQKPSDYWALPLDPDEHGEQHQIGEKTFWAKHNQQPHQLIIEHLTKYIMDNDVRQEYAVINALENYIKDNL